MAVAFHIYANDGAGGPIDYATPIGDVSATTFVAGPVGPGVHRFGVRAYDTDTGAEEHNVDAAVLIRIDDDGADVTLRPNPPLVLTAAPGPANSIKVEWGYNPGGEGAPPIGFHVWVQSASGVGAVTADTGDLLLAGLDGPLRGLSAGGGVVPADSGDLLLAGLAGPLRGLGTGGGGSGGIDYAAPPAATVLYLDGLHFYSVTVGGLISGQIYRVSARAYNASGDETNTVIVEATASDAGPAAVDLLSAEVV